MKSPSADNAAGRGNDEVIQDISRRVSAYDIRQKLVYPDTEPGDKRAAVLLAIAVRDGKLFILLTKRTQNLRAHPGAVSFPGGKRDEGDKSDVETALREAEEEIGLPRERVNVIGVLPRGITLPNTVVYPVVGLIPNDFVPNPNPSEVDLAFYVPLHYFLDNSEHMIYGNMNIRGKTFLTKSVQFEENGRTLKVWGFTANYCSLIAKIVYEDSKDIDHTALFKGMEEYFEFVKSSLDKKQKSNL